MIPIKLKSDDEADRLCNLLLGKRKGQRNLKEYESNLLGINEWCYKNIKINGIGYSFTRIIKASYDEIVEIANSFEILRKSFPQCYKEFIIKTLYSRRFPRVEFVDELQVTVCPYCNRNFVNSTYKRTMCELDHFYDKERYPILAVSFCNLVPVCHPCNHAKGRKKIAYSPYDKRFGTDDLLTFSYDILGVDFLKDSSKLAIEIETSKKFESNLNVLKLQEIYQMHGDIVQECIKKAIVFNPDYLSDIYNTYSNIFESEEELYRTVFGVYFMENDYGKRPLSKLTKDILKELLIDVYGIDLDKCLAECS